MTQPPEVSAVAAAARELDLEDLASRRWYAAKGEIPSSTRLAHAFALTIDCVLALVDVRSGERGERVDRYLMPFVVRDGVAREAAVGDGAWKALAAAIAEGRTIPALTREAAAPGERDDDSSVAGQVDAALVCRPSPGLGAAWAGTAGRAPDPGPPTDPELGRAGELARDPELVGDPELEAATAPEADPDLEQDLLPRPARHPARDLDPDVEPELQPGPGAAALILAADEAALGRDQSNTSTVIGGRLLLKAYRRIRPGLNPDLELIAYLSEEAGFPGVPRLAGYAEVVTRDAGPATVAMLQAFVADADDVYERTAEFLADLVAAPGTVSMEWATEVAADLGTLVAGLHAALAVPPADAPDLALREATHDELKAWRMDAHRQLNRAIDAVGAVDAEAAAELRRSASAIAARVSRFEAVAATPVLMRIHADLHLGQLLVADDGYRVIDFEGEPLRSIEDRRRPDSPLRDVASLLRSLDHVARSARRRAERRNGGPIERPGLDVDAWLERARARFLAAYAEGLRRSGAPIGLDLDLLDAFEVAKEAYEFVYAATVLPSWLWAPREGMRWLLAHGDPA